MYVASRALTTPLPLASASLGTVEKLPLGYVAPTGALWGGLTSPIEDMFGLCPSNAGFTKFAKKGLRSDLWNCAGYIDISIYSKETRTADWASGKQEIKIFSGEAVDVAAFQNMDGIPPIEIIELMRLLKSIERASADT